MEEKARTLTAAKAEAKEQAMAKFLAAFPDAVQIDDASYVVPVNTPDFGVQYVGNDFTVKDTKGTKATEKRPARAGFDLADAIAEYDQKKADRLQAAIDKANKAAK